MRTRRRGVDRPRSDVKKHYADVSIETLSLARARCSTRPTSTRAAYALRRDNNVRGRGPRVIRRTWRTLRCVRRVGRTAEKLDAGPRAPSHDRRKPNEKSPTSRRNVDLLIESGRSVAASRASTVLTKRVPFSRTRPRDVQKTESDTNS